MGLHPFPDDKEARDCSDAQDPEMEREKLESIAIVGLALKFPKDATDPENFWQTLIEGRSAMTEVPNDRWNIDTFYHPDPERHDCMNARNGHFLREDMAFFDAPFFSLPPSEVLCMDPQQRSLLECTYHALENAGVPIASVVGSRTSVFVGAFSHEYETMLSRDPQMQAKYMATGTGSAMLANRLSWFYDLRGPSISLDTACSSSLNALHLAVQSIRSGESNMAIVAGCNYILNPETNSIPLSNLGFLGRDGVCYSFDHRANGYARGEGTAVIVLKSITKASNDNDVLRAVIRNTGSNQDGRTPGITQPSMEAQVGLIRETYEKADLELQSTGFFEAHGTGTVIGDAREAGAIGAVFKDHREDPLIVGAVKSNVGHLEGAAGLAGLIKSIMILEKGIIPPNIWFEKPSPEIRADEWKIKFPVERMPWPGNGLRRASVNSFGYGGANCHVIIDDAFHYMTARGIPGKHCTLEARTDLQVLQLNGSHEIMQGSESKDAYALQKAAIAGRPRLFVWSASDEDGLRRLTKAYSSLLQDYNKTDDELMSSLAYTLSDRRSNLSWKSFLIGDSVSDLKRNLSTGKVASPMRSSPKSRPSLAFVFTGQGAQWYAMGRELLIYPTFAESLKRAEKHLQLLGCEWSLTEELRRSREASNVDRPAFAQPLCTALQIALVDLMEEWGLTPESVVGHSSGEIAAAYCAGLSRESAWTIAYYRGALAARIESEGKRHGSMLAVALSPQEVQPYLAMTYVRTGKEDLAVGCINGPDNVTVTGDSECIDTIQTCLEKDRIFARKLNTTVAYHSSHMRDVASEYRSLIEKLIPRQNSQERRINPKFFSSLTGDIINLQELRKPEYWVNNMISVVKFYEAFSALSRDLHHTLSDHTEDSRAFVIEVGPHGALRRPIKEILDKGNLLRRPSYHPTFSQNISARASILELVGALHCSGYSLDLATINEPETPKSELNLLTDLPPYPFNHSQRYWLESRISKNYRFNEVPRHELLGVRSSDWNPLDAKWRNIIRASELPWIRDHKFNGSELYPAAGIIVMVIEAARQMADPQREVSSYVLEDLSFLNPLLVTLDLEGVETQFHLRTCGSIGAFAPGQRTFSLYLCSNDDWTEVCKGFIAVKYKEEESSARLDPVEVQDSFEDGVRECTRALDPEDLYGNLETYGFAFGPSFQALKQVYFGNNANATATLDPREWLSKVDNGHQTQDHVIHPTTLDAVMHLTAVALSSGTWKPIPTMVPAKIEKLQISNSLLTHTQGQHLQAFTKTSFQGFRDFDFSISARDSETKQCLISFEGYRATAISTLKSLERKRLCYDIDWKPDWTLLSPEELTSYCNDYIPNSYGHDPEYVDKAELVCLYYLSETLQKVSKDELSNSQGHFSKYLSWLEMRRDEYEKSRLLSSGKGSNPALEDTERFQNLLAELQGKPAMDLINQVGKNLTQILRGEVDALGILFSEDLAKSFYEGPTFAPSYEKAAIYIDLLAHKDPSLNILEVGAGTGGFTSPILDKLSKHGLEEGGRPRFRQWTYTDISSGFLGDAAKRFNAYADLMEFKVLDIEQDPLLQGFEAGHYDVVLASAVIHATTDVERAVRHTRLLLKPGGKLILVEPCNLETIRVPFIFGLLPGWWLSSEEYRRWGPLLSHEGWDRTLKNNEFLGTEICLPDFSDDRHTISVLISTASEQRSFRPPGPPIVIVVQDHCIRSSQVAEQLKTQLDISANESCQIISFTQVSLVHLKDTFVISLLEINDPFLFEISETSWDRLKILTRSAKGILWITRGKEENPEFGLVTGLGRTLQSENADLKFVEVALDRTCSDSELVDHAIRVLKAKSNNGSYENTENEYAGRNGLLCINRVVEANYLNNKLYTQLSPQQARPCKLHDKQDRLLSLSIGNTGILDTIQFEEGELANQLEDNEVEIEVKAVGVEPRDVSIALGQIASNTMGTECSGVVSRVGAGVCSVRPGDRVCCIATGAFKNILCVDAAQVSLIPAGVSFETAASCLLDYCIAYHALVNLARVKAGESLLIQSGEEAVGQAAIQLALTLDLSIYCTVRNADKRDILMKYYGLPKDRIFVGKGALCTQHLRRITDRMDVVLHTSTSDDSQQLWECIRPLGRIIDVCPTGKQAVKGLPSRIFAKSITYATLDMELIIRESKPLLADVMAFATNLLNEKRHYAPESIHVFPSSEVSKAFQQVHSGQSAGRVVVNMSSGDLVPVVPYTGPSWYFREDASYVVVGGLGGLGRSIARWMVDRGAKHLLLLGRSGAKGETAIKLLDELRDRGVKVQAPPCDISDERSLKDTLHFCSKSMPPIRGCIQGSMVIRDGLFETMCHADYLATIRPKVHGSWNLHTYLPAPLDFFVLLSSTSGIIGTRGQSNYAAGNTYQDALAHYRVSRGLKCISLDLGLVVSVGWAAEKRESLQSIKKMGYTGIREAEMLGMLEYCCDPALPVNAATPHKSQIITGLEVPKAKVDGNEREGMDWIRWARRPLFRNLAQINADSTSSQHGTGTISNNPTTATSIDEDTTDYAALFATSAPSLAAPAAAITQGLKRKLAKLLWMPEADIDVQQPLQAYGVDSLVAVEIRYWLGKVVSADVSIFDIQGEMSMLELGGLVAGRSALRREVGEGKIDG